jgi:cytochrome c oxidase assembly protein subunit 15
LRVYSKIACAAVLVLIFMGALVTSHDAGLSVPDWPTTYGENMFLYSPSKWVGPIFYEHTHRLVASLIGMLTVILAVWIWRVEERRWVKILSALALAAVILQGLLGGLTVLLKLPDAVSVSHGMLAQTFFCLIILIAYSESQEYATRVSSPIKSGDRKLFQLSLFAVGAMYLQLLFGAIMRHSGSGLAIPDFPTMGGQWIPDFSAAMLSKINELRAVIHFAPVSMGQVVSHFIHRVWAVAVVACVLYFVARVLLSKDASAEQRSTAKYLAAGIILQLILGIAAVLTVRQPFLTSAHVMIGALMLGLSVLAAIRNYPLGATREG